MTGSYPLGLGWEQLKKTLARQRYPYPSDDESTYCDTAK
jgi:hypothetical protein